LGMPSNKALQLTGRRFGACGGAQPPAAGGAGSMTRMGSAAAVGRSLVHSRRPAAECRSVGRREDVTEKRAHPRNVPGDFYVEDGCCTLCDMPRTEAPDLFAICDDPAGYQHCFVAKQPETPQELERMLGAIECAELDCIRYRGT